MKLNKEREQSIAKETLEQLWQEWPQAVVAGGAARDWYLGKPISDIDIFICHEKLHTGDVLKEKLESILEEEVENLGDAKYAARQFEGFETVRGGVKIQFLFHHKDLETTVAEFPINVSRVWWDGEAFHYHPTFSYYTNYNSVIVNRDCNLDHELKIGGKFRDASWCIGLDGFLRNLGGAPRWADRFFGDTEPGPLEDHPAPVRDHDFVLGGGLQLRPNWFNNLAALAPAPVIRHGRQADMVWVDDIAPVNDDF